MRPLVAGIRPSTTERKVVLPQPEGPTIETNSPSMTCRSTPSSAASRVLVRGWKYSNRTPRASSLAFMARPPCSRRWTPGLDPALDAPHDLDQDHAGGDDGEHTDEHLVGLKARARLTDHGADARGRAVDFTHHHADHSASDREPKPSQHEGDRARQDDGSKQPPVAGTEARCHFDQARIGGADRSVRIDRDREQREQKDDQHPRAKPGA